MSNFDRLRPRAGANGSGRNGRVMPGSRPDAEGKRVLFSVEATPPGAARGALELTCSGCGRTSTLTARQALTAAVPSLHLPILRRKYPSWMRCPGCRRHQWVRVDLRR